MLQIQILKYKKQYEYVKRTSYKITAKKTSIRRKKHKKLVKLYFSMIKNVKTDFFLM